MGREKHQRRGLGVIGNMLDPQETAVAVPDDDRGVGPDSRTPLGRDPLRGELVVGDRLGRGLEGGALDRPAVAVRQDVVAAPVEGEAGKAERRQRRRQETRRADIEVHGVAVEQQNRADRGPAIGFVPGPVEGLVGVGFDGDEFSAHGLPILKPQSSCPRRRASIAAGACQANEGVHRLPPSRE